MTDVEEPKDTRFDDIDLENILARVERRGPLTFTRKRCLYRAPEFVKKLPKEETVEEGSTVKFECKAVGLPKPTINWTKDLETLPDNPRFTFQYGELGEATIEIQKIKKSDEGSYRCKAENAEGSSSSTVYITVKAKPKSPKRSQQRVITFTSSFTTITEKIDEEEREAEEFMRQPMSPLAYLYDTIKIRENTWPEFLGNWAFLTSDFDGINENMDEVGDEDVFLPVPTVPSDSYTNSDTDSNTDISFDNEIDNTAIPNLVFENKKLAHTCENIDFKYPENVCDLLIKDENANDRINVKCSQDRVSDNVQCSQDRGSDNVRCSKDRASDNVKCSKDRVSDNVKCSKDGVSDNGLSDRICGNGQVGRISDIVLSDRVNNNSNSFTNENLASKNYNKHSQSNGAVRDTSDKISDKRDACALHSSNNSKTSHVTSSQKRPLMSGITSANRPLTKRTTSIPSIASEKCNSQFFNMMLFLLVISGFTFLALSVDISPSDFVFTVFVGQMIYIILRYLCGYS